MSDRLAKRTRRRTVDLAELGRFAVRGVKEGRFVISHDLDRAGRLLHA